MGFIDLEQVKKQVIAILNLAIRDASGVPSYTSTVAGGDTSYSDEEIERASYNGVCDIMRTICETDGHHHRPLFTTATALTNGAVIPSHLGSPGVPRITPYSAATYTIVGKPKSMEEVTSYRANVGNRYSTIAHDAAGSKLAGYYAIDPSTQVIYFTGFSASADLATFSETDYTNLPDLYYPNAIALAIMHLKKDGDESDVFNHYTNIGMNGLASIAGKERDQPRPKRAAGNRDSGLK